MTLLQCGAIALADTSPPADPGQLPVAAPAQVLADTAAAGPFILAAALRALSPKAS